MDKRPDVTHEEFKVLFSANNTAEAAYQADNETETAEDKPDIDELIRAVFALTARVGNLESQVKELRLQALDKDTGAGRQGAAAVGWQELRHAMQTEERALAAKPPGAAEKDSAGQVRLSRVERYGKSGSKR